MTMTTIAMITMIAIYYYRYDCYLLLLLLPHTRPAGANSDPPCWSFVPLAHSPRERPLVDSSSPLPTCSAPWILTF